MNIRKRFFKTAFLVFKIVLDFQKEFILIKKKGYIYAEKKMQKTHEKRARQLYNTAVYMQGAFIKACQYLSARPDVFPEPNNFPYFSYKTLQVQFLTVELFSLHLKIYRFFLLP